ncbi:conserved Plasmodium protein, unknown function [Plasmodium knowlesi strain H]|uniref:Uncharacterized protein n=3 Tax=Plasmodium knowlesi TaxID=5850 RepID=A0A5K1U042_PLAKH|nr:conserved Plasmodium protein, unknown function [Plasmodium knowlesi strain H]OTN68378.1 Uncharacterized protein PKNOH_S03330600 [Plasmodium knowlesi]CAA9987208.1 conserved Plasmodium protein, unknown function [Plasmodium knowlesi strain H]SBO23973.1 conserved Plasmodium protein, unknown function [Plasmodium knowlesi strain H]SBO25936.1 conserved Plasmodium protein, unknown function [Plasmodium knowlesi strain H]VVS76682.1 conserved Plasmodium protein, unknown function [Plasmodium knowlesi s|eukprot:XP_002261829.1 hypothetical protein, conserved in Plasmodium species [Plasmodium knowlesi strain H]
MRGEQSGKIRQPSVKAGIIMSEKKNRAKHLVSESIVCIKRYFDLHDATVVSINELIRIILDRSANPGAGFDQTGELEDLLKNELTYAFTKEYEAVKSALINLKVCLGEMKRLKGGIQEIEVSGNSAAGQPDVVHALGTFFNSAFIHFRRDYRLKKKLHGALIYMDGACENEINRLQLMWKESPFLFTILHKHHVNKIIVEGRQFLQKTQRP